ncbi:Cupin domain-containing protein [Pleurostoma richardsiae]|uniref:Cupin domain-containing protein n=1 Tax=Pleurostoma richardsiae TaxID=41990 RepID=A0AA38R4D1_9PEZI|nr:Cupin domain-containing protein [Pleurostoma richardsiae]
MSLAVTPLAVLRTSKHFIPSHGLLPNSSIQSKPLLIYHTAFAPYDDGVPASAIESHLISLGVVTPQWRYTMYSTSHFHSTSHEVLCVSAGRARLCFGGENNPKRVEPTVQAGDVIVVPAGVAHCLLEDLSGGGTTFEMVGSYPAGHQWDMCYGKKGEEAKVQGIKSLPWFDRDPMYGGEGPTLEL